MDFVNEKLFPNKKIDQNEQELDESIKKRKRYQLKKKRQMKKRFINSKQEQQNRFELEENIDHQSSQSAEDMNLKKKRALLKK